MRNFQDIILIWTHFQICNTFNSYPQPAFICSKLTIETLDQGVKYVQSEQ